MCLHSIQIHEINDIKRSHEYIKCISCNNDAMDGYAVCHVCYADYIVS